MRIVSSTFTVSCSLVVAILATSASFASDIIFSGNAGFGLEGTVSADSGGLIAFSSDDIPGTAQVVFDFPGNLDAVHVLANGNYLVSYHSEVTIGGLTFDDDHVVEYDVATNQTTSFFDYAGLIASSPDSDIDAFFLLPNGNHVFSNTSEGVIAGLEFTNSDLVEYDPVNETASLFFNSDLIQDGDRFNNLSGASLWDDSTLAISVSTGGTPIITVGGQGFQRNDIILYDMTSGLGSMLMDGDAVRSSPVTTPVSAIHIGAAVPVPEPAASLMGLIAALGMASTIRRR